MSETEKAQVAQIRIARGRVKASMTRLESSFDELNTKNEISIRLSRLDGLFKEFERLDSTLSLEESELEEFEERYFNLSAKFNDKLDELNVLNLSGTQNSVASSITSNSNVSNFRLPKLSIPQFSEFLDVKDLDYLKSITLSDEDFMRPKECDIILGSDCFFEILRSGKIVGSKNEPIAQRTMFGWVVAGKLNVQNKEPNELYSHFLSTENDLKTDSLLQRFWETEELSVKKQFLSDEELFCEDHFQSTFKYNDQDNITKRSFLSQSARLFDPLGFLTPCTVYIKIFYQQLWLLKLDWDSPLPDALAIKWKTFRKEFEQICSIHIPRWIHTVSQQVTLHGFCDASELAYASVIYAVQPQADDSSQTVKLELAR
ncbi:DUF1758 domain-containing protein [Trichonephila clavata]|uniref:DUF1758 domain-containing protein n=1 Tax=Trichonephila clavata TaxID=2740835 RepID=A0A8X6IRR6_TRICU|nr:DUF1758 domain-containing protein [Trichonephila clavata]